MNWKDQLNKAVNAVREVAESDTARNLTARAKEKASELADKARSGALDAAQAFVQANADPNAFKVHYRSARVSIVAPTDGVEIARPNDSTLVISDGENNGLIITAASERAYVADTIGKVTRLNENTYDLGPQDGVNVVVLEP